MIRLCWTYLTLIIVVLFSCSKPEDRKCFKNVGEIRQLEMELDNEFDTLFLNGDFAYEIIPDTFNKIELEGGANLIPHIKVENENGKLEVIDGNKCAFLRDRTKKIKARIHVKEISYVFYTGTNSLQFKDTIKTSELRVYNRDGAGTMDLLVNVGYLEVVVQYGWADFKVEGNSLFTYLSCNTNSFCDARGLNTTTWLNVLSNTQGDMLINAANAEFIARIHSGGNIKYVGVPSQLELEQLGDGKLVEE